MLPLGRWPNFSDREFCLCSPSCSLLDMDPSFMDRLQTARTIAGVPFKINSAFRSVEHELSKNRSGKSMHTLGRAVDIKCCDSGSRYKIVSALVAAGFHGIGIGSTFIHVDDRELSLIWTY